MQAHSTQNAQKTPYGQDMPSRSGDVFDAIKDGAFKKAIKLARNALREMPDDFQTRLGLSAAYRAEGQLQRADQQIQKCLAAEPDNPWFLLEQANLHVEHRDWKHAHETYTSVIEKVPESGHAWYLFGKCLLQMARPRAAAQAFASAVQLEHSTTKYYDALALAFSVLREFDTAEKTYEIASSFLPKSEERAETVTVNLLKAGAAEQAARYVVTQLENYPENSRLWHHLAVAFLWLGEKEAALRAIQRSSDLEPENPSVLHDYATLMKVPGFDLEDLRKRVAKVRHQRLTPATKSTLGYTTAQIAEKDGDVRIAFDAFCRGASFAKAVQRAHQQVNIPTAEPKDQCGPSVVGPRRGVTPIFITGLPRSGTTILEQQLAYRPDTIAMGETPWVLKAAQQAHARGPFSFESTFYAQVPDIAPQTRFIIDKMPYNYRFTGHVLRDLPGSKVIFLHRDLRASCWSIFSHYFSEAGNSFSYKHAFGDITKEVKRLIETARLWQASFPGQICYLRYEDFVSNPKLAVLQLEARLGLPICTEQDNSDTPPQDRAIIRTASVLQARAPIYQGSNESWRKYEPFASDWFRTLGQLDTELASVFRKLT